jgi:hypothetical protein
MTTTVQQRKHFLNAPFTAEQLRAQKKGFMAFFEDLDVGETLTVQGGDDEGCLVVFCSYPEFTFKIPESMISVEISKVVTTPIGTLTFKECSEQFPNTPYREDHGVCCE